MEFCWELFWKPLVLPVVLVPYYGQQDKDKGFSKNQELRTSRCYCCWQIFFVQPLVLCKHIAEKKEIWEACGPELISDLAIQKALDLGFTASSN